jgi:hypothetical protein
LKTTVSSARSTRQPETAVLTWFVPILGIRR